MPIRGLKLFKIRGGVHPNANKDATHDKPITDLPIPELLRIPLLQHIGSPAEPVVKRGEHVLKGQLLARPQGVISAPVHAPTSGRIISIGKFQAPHPSGLPVMTITLKSDGKDEWVDSDAVTDPFDMEPAEIAQKVSDAGIVGMGGATFPSAVKLGLGNRYQLEKLIINGAECEPYLTCDDRLMQESADEIIDGIRIMIHTLGVKEAIIAIEKNKPGAINAISVAAADYPEIKVIGVPVQYPMGSEKHLTQTLTGKETPARALTADLGIVVHNVATAYAIHQALRQSKPLLSRIVTVTGGAISKPGNFRALIGTPVSHFIEHCGGLTEEPAKLLLGGPMMGQPLPSTKAPIIKGSGGILALTEKELRLKNPSPCIRCASCVNVCPCGLLPLEMASHARAGDLEGAADFGLMDCISCGSCSYVCPSHIPLVQYFNYAKGALTEKQRAQHKQEEIKRLIAARAERMEKQKQAKREAMARRKAEMAEKKKQQSEASA